MLDDLRTSGTVSGLVVVTGETDIGIPSTHQPAVWISITTTLGQGDNLPGKKHLKRPCNAHGLICKINIFAGRICSWVPSSF